MPSARLRVHGHGGDGQMVRREHTQALGWLNRQRATVLSERRSAGARLTGNAIRHCNATRPARAHVCSGRYVSEYMPQQHGGVTSSRAPWYERHVARVQPQRHCCAVCCNIHMAPSHRRGCCWHIECGKTLWYAALYRRVLQSRPRYYIASARCTVNHAARLSETLQAAWLYAIMADRRES